LRDIRTTRASTNIDELDAILIRPVSAGRIPENDYKARPDLQFNVAFAANPKNSNACRSAAYYTIKFTDKISEKVVEPSKAVTNRGHMARSEP
jgi:hypothetical protein